MSEQEFELYLSLLSRFLKLNPSQHKDILDELRDHLEARLEELSQSGLSREEAVRSALDEFGDATHLADYFTQLAQRRKRRFIMRCTMGSVAGMAALILVTLALWPEIPVALQPPQRASAQQDERIEPIARRPEAANEDKIRKELLQPTDVNFVDIILPDALAYLGEKHHIPMYYDRKSLDNEGIQLEDVVVSFGNLSGITLRSALDLMFAPHGIDYIIKNEVLIITTGVAAEEALETRVYDVRSLLDSGIFEPAATASLQEEATTQGATRFAGDHSEAAMKRLEEVIMRTIRAEWDKTVGGGGVIENIGGILVIRQSYHAHEEIAQLLSDLDQLATRRAGHSAG